MKKLLVLALVAVALGCGFSEKSLVGKWTGKIEVSEEDKAKMKDNPMAGVAQSFMDAMQMHIEFKADHTYTSTLGDGTWTYADHKVNLTATKLMGLDVTKAGSENTAMVMQVSSNGKTLTLASNTNPNGSGYLFTRDDAQ